MSYLQDNSKLEALTKAVLISILGVAIVLSNLLIIATYANFKGKLGKGKLARVRKSELII